MVDSEVSEWHPIENVWFENIRFIIHIYKNLYTDA